MTINPSGRSALRSLGAAVLLVALVAGVPALLALTIGNPLGGWDALQAGDITDAVVIDLLAAVAYVAWAQFASAVAVELVAALRQAPAPQLPGFGFGQQQLARNLVAAALLAGPVLGTASLPAQATFVGPAAVPAVVATQAAAPAAVRDHREVTIRAEGPGTFWDLAEVHLGRGERWPEIWKANEGRQQADGTRMTQPGLLRPGWTVLIPAAEGTVRVRPGDTLSSVAADHEVGRWQDLWEVNRGRVQPDGERLVDPDHIEPGWTLDLPDGTPEEAPAGTRPSPQPAPPTRITPLATATPLHEAASAPATEASASVADEADDDLSPVTLVSLGFGGGLLSGVTLAALLRCRRRQFRYRRPGRSIPAVTSELAAAEKALRVAGTAGIVDVTWLDHALRGLAHSLAASPGGRLPDLLAVRMEGDVLDLVLAAPDHHAPPAWTVLDDGKRWRTVRGAHTGYDAGRREYHFAPYPALVSVGHTAGGEQWLLDLERLAAVRLTGDRDRCLNLARFIAAELAHNVWSEQLEVTLVGFGAELAVLNLDRLRLCDEPEALAAASSRLVTSREVAQRGGDPLTGRLRNVDADVWMPSVVLLAPERESLERHELMAQLAEDGRTSVAVLTTADPGTPGWELSVDADGVLRLPALGVELIAQQVPQHEAAQLAELLAAAAHTGDVHPSPARGDQPWDDAADVHGALLPAMTVTRSPAPAGASAIPALHVAESSILPMSAGHYVDRAATTRDDVEALAPAVTPQVRRQVEDADPTLDADVAAWHAETCELPRLTLLGPVDVRAHGPLPSSRPRKAWNVEIVAYLAAHPRGVTAEQFGTDLWPDDPDIVGKSKLRQSIYITRKWLGTNPRTGTDHLPPATPSSGGLSLYRVEDLLVDAELFRRLRLRGLARGIDGLPDLHIALGLVTGVPLDQRRPGGYTWLVDTPLDHEYTAMIVDVAHLVATHHLAAGDPAQARAAAEVALTAGSTDDIALLDLVAVCDAEGNRAEADSYIRRIMANHDAEVEEDLPPRTAQILHHRHMHRAS